MDMAACSSKGHRSEDLSLTEDSESDSTEDEEDEDDDGRHKAPRIHINMQAIPCIQPLDQDAVDLQDLGVTAYDQSCYEEGVMKQIDTALEVPQDAPKTGKRQDAASLLTDFAKPTALPSTSSSRTPPSATQVHTISDDDEEDEYKPESETEESDVEEEDDEFLPSDDETKKKRKPVAASSSPSKRLKTSKVSRVPYLEDKAQTSRVVATSDKPSTSKMKDDGDDKFYAKRMKKVKQELLLEKEEFGEDSLTEMEELGEGFKVPCKIWSKLFPHQQMCVKWLWELHKSCIGGIIGDEMGLGKTIQVIAFLAGLKSSDVDNFRESFRTLGPSIIVCPATVMHQWVSELYKWYPLIRVAILHSTGSYSGGKSSLIRKIHRSNGILIMTYSCAKDYQEDLSDFDWHYVVLDEGHKIRNPDAQITLACKRFRTPHRIILSGSPIQNNLKELWSLFDFIIPGKLGTLPVFMEQFSIPITQGGYANASDVQVKIAFKCATVLRDTIKPFLLRRMKEDVKDAICLPKKNEQVLFCRLTDEQRNLYREYLQSPDIRDILRGSNQMFVGLINLRKICNHPDLFDGFKQGKVKTSVKKAITEDVENDTNVIDYFTRSGKMLVIQALLQLWHRQKHKVLLFSQGTQMMNILEKFLKLKEYTYIKLDGSTSIGQRQPLINRFNQDPEIFVFLLTTRVGGIGVNLTGATRVLIYDPDWNPSTDTQARERAWRIGQDQQVTIYRLLTAGTIEEKIYHRQVFKQYLTNRVLRDPRQRRFFKTNDLYELFTLGNESESTESSAIFAGTGSDVTLPDASSKSGSRKSKSKKSKKKKKHRHKQEDGGGDEGASVGEVSLSDEKKQQLRDRARQLSLLLAKKFEQQLLENKQQEDQVEAASQVPTNATLSAVAVQEEKSRSKKHKSKKKKRKNRVVEIDGEEIENLVKQDTYNSVLDRVKGESSDKQDEYVLSQLFKSSKNAVHSALQHDVIEGGAVIHDYTLVEAEADKVAQDAIAALQQSRRQCFSASSGIPTWTGQSGKLKAAAAGSKKPAFGSSASSSILSAIKSRSRLDQPDEPDADRQTRDDPSAEHEDMLRDLRSFISFQSTTPGQATTQEVLQRFADRLPSHQTPVFKAFLWKVADFHRLDGTGVWRLKPEFA